MVGLNSSGANQRVATHREGHTYHYGTSHQHLPHTFAHRNAQQQRSLHEHHLPVSAAGVGDHHLRLGEYGHSRGSVLGDLAAENGWWLTAGEDQTDSCCLSSSSPASMTDLSDVQHSRTCGSDSITYDLPHHSNTPPYGRGSFERSPLIDNNLFVQHIPHSPSEDTASPALPSLLQPFYPTNYPLSYNQHHHRHATQQATGPPLSALSTINQQLSCVDLTDKDDTHYAQSNAETCHYCHHAAGSTSVPICCSPPTNLGSSNHRASFLLAEQPTIHTSNTTIPTTTSTPRQVKHRTQVVATNNHPAMSLSTTSGGPPHPIPTTPHHHLTKMDIGYLVS
eukprot:TRINITY_DN15169_c0_g1_i1.p1 TRINITY_DN15169_c0_g1~~TRINITY_DN15169_c0_g1_i1.p1  ORF type:complete len:380 (+),score=57.91 TRINITY_DN15169_c0_g1_i1:131-1141(+)